PRLPETRRHPPHPHPPPRGRGPPFDPHQQVARVLVDVWGSPRVLDVVNPALQVRGSSTRGSGLGAPVSCRRARAPRSGSVKLPYRPVYPQRGGNASPSPSIAPASLFGAA